MNPYKTLLMENTAEYVVQKSRFLGLAAPVQTEEEALALLRRVREEHRTANHHCYAYIVGQNAGVMRYSDDGEPGSTAGMPILEVLRARGVVNCAVVVTRYFGGILLGAGGLTRAYSHSCALAVEAAGVCEMLPTQRWLCEVAYPLWDRVQHALRGLPVRVDNAVFTTAVQFELLTRTADADALLDTLARITDGRAETLLLEELYQPWPETAGQEA
jgi:uncharacterized YigZ family protein